MTGISSTRIVEARLRFSAENQTSMAFKEIGKSYGYLNERANKFNSAQQEFWRRQEGLAKTVGSTWLRYAAPAAIGLAAKKSLEMAGNMEETMFNIQKKYGGTADEIARMKREILELAGEMPVATSQIAAAYERAAASGIPLDEMKEFVTLSVQTADAWDMSSEGVSNFFAGMQAGMGLDFKQLENLADLVNYLADSGIADEYEIANFIDRVGASLRNFGLTPEQIAAYGAALLNLKMPAEIAARAMDTLAGKLAAPENLSEKSFGALEKIVGDIDSFRDVIARDASEGLIFFLTELEKRTGQERISLLGALMGEGFDDEVARMVGGLQEIIRNLEMAQEKNAYQGSIAGLSEKRLDLYNSKLTVMKNNLGNIMTMLGERGIGPIGGAVQWANDALSDNAAYSAGLEKLGVDNGLFGRGDEMEKYAEYIRKYRELLPNAKHLDFGSGWTRDIRALGRGEIDDLYQNIERDGALSRRYDRNWTPDLADGPLFGESTHGFAFDFDAQKRAAEENARILEDGGANAGQKFSETASDGIASGADQAGKTMADSFWNFLSPRLNSAGSAVAPRDTGRDVSGPGDL